MKSKKEPVKQLMVENPNLTLEQIGELYAKQDPEGVSDGVLKAAQRELRKDGNGVASDNGRPTYDQFLEVKELVKQAGGVDQVTEAFRVLDPIAEVVGGNLAKVRECLKGMA